VRFRLSCCRLSNRATLIPCFHFHRAIAREVSTKQVSIQVAESRAKYAQLVVRINHLEASSIHLSSCMLNRAHRNILEVMGAEASPAVLRSLAWAFRKIYRYISPHQPTNQESTHG